MSYPNNQGLAGGAIPVWSAPPPGTVVPTGAVSPILVRKQIVEAGQTNVRIGPASAGNWVGMIVLLPLTTSPGAITMKDGSGGSDVTIFAGGASSVVDLSARGLPAFGYGSEATGIFITTGANMRVFLYGNWPN